MNIVSSIVALAGPAAPLFHEGGNETLATWKAILTTVLVVVAIVQGVNQAVVRGWIGTAPSKPKKWLGLHRVTGILAIALVLLLSGLGLYAAWALEAPMDSTGRVVHAILGGLAAVVLLVKAATSNRFRSRLYLNLPLGIAAAVLLLAIFAISAFPHFADLLAAEGSAWLVMP
jgi:hypothetical protein